LLFKAVLINNVRVCIGTISCLFFLDVVVVMMMMMMTMTIFTKVPMNYTSEPYELLNHQASKQQASKHTSVVHLYAR
jgi:hypothetical protein